MEKNKLKILMVSPEAVPYIKSGGLADAVGALAETLARAGHEVGVVLPLYSAIDYTKNKLEPFHSPMEVYTGESRELCAVHRSISSSGVNYYFIEYNAFYSRDGIYHDPDFKDFTDNAKRYAFLSGAALKLCLDIGFKPDIVHAHDWQGAAAMAYLKIWYHSDPILSSAKGFLTIHNLGHQGVYPVENYNYLGFGWENFTSDKYEDHGRINLLKGGMFFADAVNTVSPNYARETLYGGMDEGLGNFLHSKGNKYFGILNGADYSEWDPSTDKFLPANYSSEDLAGKRICKEKLQDEFKLKRHADVPIIGVVGRFAYQKGIDVIASVIDGILQNMEIQFVILGTGDKSLEHFFGDLPKRWPGKAGSYIGYSNELAHLIEAGSDLFLMPSRYEPCGLNQIYSLRYGTLPIVRDTGGLTDTVEQYIEADGSGTGFLFKDLNSTSLYFTVGWAISTYYDRKNHMSKMIQSAMAKNFSWEKAAEEYLRAYRGIL
ncbi:MAG: glycogen synthase [Elusimicrobia bacterium]|nr:glycogen synthase [Elusimicrobiota bacterium]